MEGTIIPQDEGDEKQKFPLPNPLARDLTLPIMSSHPLTDKLLKLEEQFLDDNGREPTILYLSVEDEAQLPTLNALMDAYQKKALKAGKARESLKKLREMTIYWDAPVTSVA